MVYDPKPGREWIIAAGNSCEIYIINMVLIERVYDS
jgi:hypothetical protein